jgi:hypothetical protein
MTLLPIVTFNDEGVLCAGAASHFSADRTCSRVRPRPDKHETRGPKCWRPTTCGFGTPAVVRGARRADDSHARRYAAYQRPDHVGRAEGPAASARRARYHRAARHRDRHHSTGPHVLRPGMSSGAREPSRDTGNRPDAMAPTAPHAARCTPARRVVATREERGPTTATRQPNLAAEPGSCPPAPSQRSAPAQRSPPQHHESCPSASNGGSSTPHRESHHEPGP